MTHEQRKVYEDKIDNLVAEQSRSDCNIKEAEIALTNYYKDLQAIQEKYDYQTKYNKLNEYKRAYGRAKTKLITVKLQYICCMINEFLNSKLFYHDSLSMKWLERFKIFCDEYERNFKNLYIDIIDTDDFDQSDWTYSQDKSMYIIYYEWHWRCESDGEVTLMIPEHIVNNLNSFIAEFNKSVQELKAQRSKEQMEAEEKKKAERYDQYLKLKQEFGG